MKRLVIILLISLVFSSCKSKDIDKEEIKNTLIDKMTVENKNSEESTSTDKENEKEIVLNYPLDENKKYEKYDKLYVNRMLDKVASNLDSSKKSAYSKKDFLNIDLNKDVYFKMLNFRTPQRSQIFTEDKKKFYIDFPKTDKYNLSISFEALLDEKNSKENDKNLDFDSLVDKYCEKIVEENNLEIKTGPIKNYSAYKNSTYFMATDEKNLHTLLFVESPNNIIFFDFVEDISKDYLLGDLMADMLATAYPDSEDSPIITKNFKNMEKDMETYSTKKTSISDTSMNLPENLSQVQDDKNLKVYEAKKSGNIFEKVILTSESKKEKNIGEIFNKNSGSYFEPTYLVNIGELSNKKTNNLSSLSSDVKYYSENACLFGNKITLETNDSYITIIVLGPLENSNLTDLIFKNILSSIKA